MSESLVHALLGSGAISVGCIKNQLILFIYLLLNFELVNSGLDYFKLRWLSMLLYC
jgi:hypothetical protein